MNLVLTGAVGSDLRERIAARVRAHRVVPLHAGAWRFESADDGPQARADVATLCAAARVDFGYVEPGKRLADLKLLAMDMDSTLITIECIDEIADFVGKKEEVAAITEAAMRGEIPDFAESLRRRVALLAGTPETVLKTVFDERLRLSPGAETLLNAARQNGLFLLLLSGGFTYFTDRLRDELGLDAAYANTLDIVDGRLTGRVREPILDARGKARHVRETLAHLHATPDQALVIGDGANDIPMMGEVTYSVAFRAKPATARMARIAIGYGGLDAVADYF